MELYALKVELEFREETSVFSVCANTDADSSFSFSAVPPSSFSTALHFDH